MEGERMNGIKIAGGKKKPVLDTVCLAWVWLESVPLTFLS